MSLQLVTNKAFSEQLIIEIQIKRKKHTNTRDSISRVSRMTRAVEGSFSVGAVGIIMAVMSKMFIFIRYVIGKALVHI